MNIVNEVKNMKSPKCGKLLFFKSNDGCGSSSTTKAKKKKVAA